MLKLSEELEQLSACDDYSNGLYGLPERAAALEIEIDALKAERATILSENEALKNARNRDGILKERDHWSRRAEKAESELEAARKQEPFAWGIVTPDGVRSAAVLNNHEKYKRDYPELTVIPLYASPVPAQQSAAVTQGIAEAAHEVTRALTALRHTRDAFEIGGLIRSDLNSICDVLDVTASKLFQIAKGGENER